jgi:hypothetical protein
MNSERPPVANASYVLPLSTRVPLNREFARYVGFLSGQLQVVVVDDSPQEVFDRHEAAWGQLCSHVRVDPELATPNGKVGGVLTGLRLSEGERVIIADDDVRYDSLALARMLSSLEDHSLVRPQNYFDPVPWHAAWDSSRSLLNRVLGGDWPGTLGVHRSAVLEAGGYRGDVLFENFQLVKTLRAAGHSEQIAFDLFIRRLPCSTRHFWSQRIRQAYDEWGRPHRLIIQLSIVPLLLAGTRRWPARTMLLWLSGSISLAEMGRRRSGATSFFAFRCSLWAPVWILERGICAWVAVSARSGGGVHYGNRRLLRAAGSVVPRKVRADEV